jgi:hypothetical protein
MAVAIPLALASTVAKQQLKKTAQKSIAITGYDFVGLSLRLIFFFGFAFVIDIYFKATISGGTFLNVLGLNLPTSMPQWLTDFFTVGVKGFKFWDVIKIISIALVVLEYFRYEQDLKRSNESPNPTTTGLFALITLGLSLITIPELIQKIKEKKIVGAI